MKLQKLKLNQTQSQMLQKYNRKHKPITQEVNRRINQNHDTSQNSLQILIHIIGLISLKPWLVIEPGSFLLLLLVTTTSFG